MLHKRALLDASPFLQKLFRGEQKEEGLVAQGRASRARLTQHRTVEKLNASIGHQKTQAGRPLDGEVDFSSI